MVNIREVAQGIHTFETPLPGVSRILTVYVIRGRPGVLLDPGPSTAIPQVREALKQLGVSELSYIIPTHIHIDHAGAIGELASLFPEAKVVLHPLAVRHIADPSRLIESTRMAFGEHFEESWGTIMPVPESRMKVPQDGETVAVGDRKLTFIYSPGHAPHHIAVYDEKTGGIFSGEALGVPRDSAGAFPLPAVVPPSFDMEVYIETMKKLQAVKPRLIFYGHDGVGKEPDKLIQAAIENTRILGDIILKALKDGEGSREVGEKTQQYISERTGVKSEYTDRTMTVTAYTQYFKKKGLI